MNKWMAAYLAIFIGLPLAILIYSELPQNRTQEAIEEHRRTGQLVAIDPNNDPNIRCFVYYGSNNVAISCVPKQAR